MVTVFASLIGLYGCHRYLYFNCLSKYKLIFIYYIGA
jgi:hypothetical protein